MIFNGLSDVNFGSGVQIATGSYVGTGTYGANNPNTLTFEFDPGLVIVQNAGAGNAGSVAVFVKNSEFMTVLGVTQTYLNTVNWGISNAVGWYSTQGSNQQFNTSGYTFHYIALGTGGGVTEQPTQLTARIVAADVSNPFTILKPRGITYEFVEQVGNQYRYSFTVTPGTIQLASSATSVGTMGVKFEFIDATPSGQFEEAPYTALTVAIPESNRVNGEYTFTCLMNEKISPYNDSFGFKVTPI